MAELVWDDSGNKLYETGVEKGVVYVDDVGYAWNGLISVSESPSGAEATPLYANNTKYLELMSNEEFGASIEAYTYPDEFGECDGTKDLVAGVKAGQQTRKVFGLAYKTKIGNDVDGEDHGYKIHLIYGAKASPSEKSYSTINDSPEAVTFSWDLTTTPVAVTGSKPTSTIVIDSTKADATALAAFETILYGDVATDPRLPLPDEVVTLLTP